MVEGECVNMQIDLIINYRILLQSLRASSLPEGAFYAHPRRQFPLDVASIYCRSLRLRLAFAPCGTKVRLHFVSLRMTQIFKLLFLRSAYSSTPCVILSGTFSLPAEVAKRREGTE